MINSGNEIKKQMYNLLLVISCKHIRTHTCMTFYWLKQPQPQPLTQVQGNKINLYFSNRVQCQRIWCNIFKITTEPVLIFLVEETDNKQIHNISTVAHLILPTALYFSFYRCANSSERLVNW